MKKQAMNKTVTKFNVHTKPKKARNDHQDSRLHQGRFTPKKG